ncbi:MAG: hypothetical protein M3409_11170 [Gemmatimonadota bacterium]|jgi:hypothetical protein|nr:hypothetical protein [Gemmatimonadota bacterium]
MALPRPLHLLPFLLLVAAGGCQEQRATREEYLAVVPQIVDFLERDAREQAFGEGARGPLIVNVESFRGGGYRATREQFTAAEIQRAIGRPVLALQDSAAILCEESDVAPGCWVREYGVLLRLGLVRQSPEQMRVFATSTVTDQRFIPSVICDRRWELVFSRMEQGYRLRDRILLRECEGT